MEVQTALNASQDENRRKYDLEVPMVCVWRGGGGSLFASYAIQKMEREI